MIIAIDFDGTLVDHVFPKIGQEVPGAFNVLRGLLDNEHRLILWTIRTNKFLRAAVDYCREMDISFWGINENPGQKFWGNGFKVYAELYIDDAAFGCPLIQIEGFNRLCVDWSIICADFMEKGMI